MDPVAARERVRSAHTPSVNHVAPLGKSEPSQAKSNVVRLEEKQKQQISPDVAALRTCMFRWTSDQTELPETVRKLLDKLVYRMLNTAGEIWPSLNTIYVDTEERPTTVKEGLRFLKELTLWHSTKGNRPSSGRSVGKSKVRRLALRGTVIGNSDGSYSLIEGDRVIATASYRSDTRQRWTETEVERRVDAELERRVDAELERRVDARVDAELERRVDAELKRRVDAELKRRVEAERPGPGFVAGPVRATNSENRKPEKERESTRARVAFDGTEVETETGSVELDANGIRQAFQAELNAGRSRKYPGSHGFNAAMLRRDIEAKAIEAVRTLAGCDRQEPIRFQASRFADEWYRTPALEGHGHSLAAMNERDIDRIFAQLAQRTGCDTTAEIKRAQRKREGELEDQRLREEYEQARACRRAGAPFAPSHPALATTAQAAAIGAMLAGSATMPAPDASPTPAAAFKRPPDARTEERPILLEHHPSAANGSTPTEVNSQADAAQRLIDNLALGAPALHRSGTVRRPA